MFLFFDVETTGIPIPGRPRLHWSQPRVVQFGAAVRDEMGRPVRTWDALVRPDGWSVPPEAEDVHGWTTEDCAILGMPLVEALDALASVVDGCRIVVGHNVHFDLDMVAREAERIGRSFPLAGLSPFCTMRAATPALRLPGGPRGSWRWPSLDECREAFRLPGHGCAHDALVDACDCADLFFALADLGWIDPEALLAT